MTTLDKTGIETARNEFVHCTTKEQIERWAYKWADDLLSTADALSSLPAQAVGVKALEWEDRNPYKGVAAPSVLGRYVIEPNAGTWRVYCGPQYDVRGAGSSLVEAKAAAQADYQQRILSALVAPSESTPMMYRKVCLPFAIG